VADAALALPDVVVGWMREVGGGRVTRADRVPGGASREAWFVDVELPDGTRRELFLRYSRVPTPKDSIFHSLRVEGEIMAALGGTDVRVPGVLAVHPEVEAILEERVGGATWFYRIADPDEQVRVAQDFVTCLAALHRLDPTALHLPSLGPVRTAREHLEAELQVIRGRAAPADRSIDPLLEISLDWLDRHMPAYESPVVVVQGDTGPGNFMYEDGKVTAVVDWELAHFGDPMDDVAWLSLRTVQDTFTHLPDRLAEYEALSGHVVDEDRVWYYRLLAEVRLASNGSGGSTVPASGSGWEGRDLGNRLIYSMLHRRLTLEALGHLTGVAAPELDLPDPPPAEEWHQLYDGGLGMLRAITAREEDPLALQWSKGVVRVLKYLKELDRSGRRLAEAEREDAARLLGRWPTDVAEGRRELALAYREGQVDQEVYVGYLWRQVRRDDYLMREASGQLTERTWPPLR